VRMRSTIGPLILAAALLAPASPASAASFVATLKAPTHHPKAGKHWTITVSARTRSGHKLHATAVYKFLYQGQVVSTQYPSPHHPGARHSPYRFYGSYRDPIPWPARAVGQPLVFRVVVSVRGRGTRTLNYAVRVRR
jgi:hypothetical protein